MTETTWQTKAPAGKKPGTAIGEYTITTKNVTATSYHWGGVSTSVLITIE